jgi:acetyl-CoA synthetase
MFFFSFYDFFFFFLITGFYFTGDGAHVDKNGFIQITGRVDDVINVRY